MQSAPLSPASPNAAERPLQPYQAPNWGCGGGGMSPFTPTKDLKKRKDYFKRTAFIMQVCVFFSLRCDAHALTRLAADAGV